MLDVRDTINKQDVFLSQSSTLFMSFYLGFALTNPTCQLFITCSLVCVLQWGRLNSVDGLNEKMDPDHTHLLLVGPEARTSDCNLGKKPCWYLPWPIFMSNKCGWMAVWSIFISRCSMAWAGEQRGWGKKKLLDKCFWALSQILHYSSLLKSL